MPHKFDRRAPQGDTNPISTSTRSLLTSHHLPMSGRADFEAVFPEIVDELDEIISKTKLTSEAREWIKHALVHNTMGGKLNRGLSVIDTYKLVLDKKELTKDEYKKVAVLGWTVELLQAFFLVADDIMDAAYTRRGNPCWYKTPGVGMIAINDAFIIESCIYILLRKYFKGTPYYLNLVELYHDVTFDTELGQLVDLITAPEDSVDLSKFSMDKYMYIVTYKTAFYSFYLPVALGLYLADKATESNLAQCKKVLLPLGAYFQVQDDYLDCYGDPKVIGKIGTDIQDNKCGWLINTALLKATADQRAVLDANYGKKDQAAEAKIKEVFKEIDVAKFYHEYEEETVTELRALIEKTDESQGLKKEVFTAFLNKIYKRQK